VLKMVQDAGFRAAHVIGRARPGESGITVAESGGEC